MKSPKTLVLFPEDLHSAHIDIPLEYVCLEYFKSVQEKEYDLIIFLDTRVEYPVVWYTKILKNNLITSLVKV